MKKVLALLLAMLMLVGLLAGCSNTGEETSTAPSAGTTSSTDTTPTETPTTAPSYEGPIEDEGDTLTYDLPLVDDIYEFEYWIANSSSFDEFSTYDDNMFYQWMEDQTNVHIVFNHPASGSESESFQTMVLSGEFPDFVHSVKSYYTGGVDKAIQDGFLLALNDYIDLMPNYKAEVYRTEEAFIQAVSDEGNLWGIHHIVDRPQGSWIGLAIRQDWLDDLGLTTADVETVDGLESVLEQFLDQKTYEQSGPYYPAMGGFNYSTGLNGSFGAASVTWTNNGIINVDGSAVYSPATQGFKDYVALMADWYSRGLVNKNYIADLAFSPPEERWANGEVGVGDFVYTAGTTYANAAAASELNPDPDFHLVAIATPKLNADDDWTDIHMRNTQGKIRPGNSMGITTQCSDIELACAYWNHVWSDEGKIASNWGNIEGEYGDINAHYFIDETDANGDGHTYCYQPWMMEKWQNISNVQVKFAVHNGPTYSIWSREFSYMTQEEIGFMETWDQVSDDYMWPEGVTLTTEEGNEASTILTACSTLVNEWVAAVITGEKSVDTWETELVPNLEANNYSAALELYQAALSRYNNRIEFMEE